MLNWITTYIPPWFWILLVVHLGSLGTVAYMILLERKVASWAQDRVGPNRVGLGFGIIPKLKDFHFWGLGQPLADGLKFLVKEDYRPKNVDKLLFSIAPMLMIAVVIVSIAVIPWGGVMQSTIQVPLGTDAVNVAGADRAVDLPWWMSAASVTNIFYLPGNQGAEVTYRYAFQIADLNIGVLFVIAFLSLAVYGVVVGGWASNNKFSFLGGLRATANMISYEIPLGLAILCIVATFGTLSLGDLVDKQLHYWAGFIPAWNIFTHPLAFVLFLVCIHAEANRAPFDIAEAEQELVGGYHTEYSSMRFALFFLAEYAGMITTSAVCVALFLGGWHLPWVEWLWAWTPVDPANPGVYGSIFICIFNALVFFAKTMAIIFVFMWTRWSLPRFRFDQIMQLAWRALIPISLALLAGTTLVIYFFGGARRENMQVGEGMAIALLAANVIIAVATLFISKVIPPAPATNRRVKVENSRFNPTTPAPAVIAN